jgi:hypothetical protein
MLVMMVVVAVIMPVMAPMRLAAHGDPASLAELRRLRFHASRDPRHIGDDVGTKPHRIGRACLAGGLAALGRCMICTTKKQSEQDYGAGQLNNPHG